MPDLSQLPDELQQIYGAALSDPTLTARDRAALKDYLHSTVGATPSPAAPIIPDGYSAIPYSQTINAKGQPSLVSHFVTPEQEAASQALRSDQLSKYYADQANQLASLIQVPERIPERTRTSVMEGGTFGGDRTMTSTFSGGYKMRPAKAADILAASYPAAYDAPYQAPIDVKGVVADSFGIPYSQGPEPRPAEYLNFGNGLPSVPLSQRDYLTIRNAAWQAQGKKPVNIDAVLEWENNIPTTVPPELLTDKFKGIPDAAKATSSPAPEEKKSLSGSTVWKFLNDAQAELGASYDDPKVRERARQLARDAGYSF